MWEIVENSIHALKFENLDPEEILFEFNGPQIFTFSQDGLMFFAYTSFDDEESEIIRLLVVATNKQELCRLREGGISIEEVLRKDLVWAIDKSYDGKVLHVALLRNGLEDVPEGFKPRNGVLLWSHLEREKRARAADHEKLLEKIALLSERIRLSHQAERRLLRQELVRTHNFSPYPAAELDSSALIIRNYLQQAQVDLWGFREEGHQAQEELSYSLWSAQAYRYPSKRTDHETSLAWYAKHTRINEYG
ncbi:hypothetical protein [Variovorax sp. tm]|uniref:hypothetical protein n=1 Tax=Variovorax atrisoli TaxID=3394203 RepID=UPI003A80731E